MSLDGLVEKRWRGARFRVGKRHRFVAVKYLQSIVVQFCKMEEITRLSNLLVCQPKKNQFNILTKDRRKKLFVDRYYEARKLEKIGDKGDRTLGFQQSDGWSLQS